MEEVWVIILAIIGLIITGYIAIAHARNKKVVCPITKGDCNVVLDSEWSTILGIKNEILGLVYYIALLIGLIVIKNYPSALLAMKGAAIVSLLYSVFLITIQTKVLKQFCFYCLLTALVNMGLFLTIVL